MTEFGGKTQQWFGRQTFDGQESFTIVANFEARFPNYALIIGINPKTGRRTICDGTFRQEGEVLSGKTTNYRVFDLGTRTFITLAEDHRRNKSTEDPPSEAEYTARANGKKITGTFQNNFGQKGAFEIWKGCEEPLENKNRVYPQIVGPLTWDKFKLHLDTFSKRPLQILFRGQTNQLPLRTAFHRSERNNLTSYSNQDLIQLRHRINAISTHYYQTHPEDMFGLLSLAQHHGFPTPLLDWSQSPYVAAFFAFDLLKSKKEWDDLKQKGEAVRILTFDQENWKSIKRFQAVDLLDPIPDLQFVQPSAHNNPRYYAQQSVAAFSNVDDIEGFVSSIENRYEKKCLTRIDILASEREKAAADLRFMGITAASLFPGIEGACRGLRDELF